MQIRSTIIIFLLSLLAIPAIAGQTYSTPIVVDLAERVAYGVPLTARTSKNDIEEIGCGTRAFSDGLGQEGAYVFCRAVDATGTQVTCFAFSDTRPSVYEAAKTINDYSYVVFSWDENDECEYIGFSTRSVYLPAVKDK